MALHAWDDIYGLALIAAAVWLTLIYFVTARPQRSLSGSTAAPFLSHFHSGMKKLRRPTSKMSGNNCTQ